MNRRTTTTLASGLIFGGAITLVLAGPLDPPSGPVAPTYKTLTEVEPRVAINATNTPGDSIHLFRITAPGSYYLTGNVTGVSGKRGILIAADDVSIDLMGFRLGGVAGSAEGIKTDTARRNITIRNGTVDGWGSEGIALTNGVTASFLVEDIQASNNGDDGIITMSNGVIRSCTALGNGGYGIYAGDNVLVESCVSRANDSTGFRIGFYSIIADCIATTNGGNGITTGADCIVRGCTSGENTEEGIRAWGDRCLVVGNVASNNIIAGIVAGSGTDDCRFENNLSDANGSGYVATGVRNLFIRNKARGNGANYANIGGGNFRGTIVGTEGAMNAAENGNVNWSF
jgi:hypothetical protein